VVRNVRETLQHLLLLASLLQQETALVFRLPHYFLVEDDKIVEKNILQFSVEMVSR
jgi:hypothetical protein